jgi:hypothetical protein
LEPVRCGEAVVVVEGEAADSGVVESVLFEERPIDERLDDDMVLRVEMDDDARGHGRVVGHHPAFHSPAHILVDAEQHPWLRPNERALR